MEMSKADIPRSFGVFKPIGHTVISLATSEALVLAVSAFKEIGFSATSLTQYTPEEMMAQVDADLLSASPLAEVGQEVNLVKAHWDLAKSGCRFLVVYAPDDEHESMVDSVIEKIKPVTAQRYGRFIIEELVSPANGNPQLPETPEAGLDISSGKRA